MAFELTTRFITHTTTEDEARAEFALFLANAGAAEIADSAEVRQVDLEHLIA